MSYTELTIKQLYGRSYNECNHPDCSQIIIVVDSNTGKMVNHGKIAHIRGRKQGAERYVKDYPKEKLNSEENLILLCQVHHDTIDQKGAEKYYKIELVEEWKAAHYQAKEIIADREWVYGASKLLYGIGKTQYTLEYWRDKNGVIRFFTPDQIKQARAATDLSIFFAELGSLLRNIESTEGKPADPSHITMNDSYVSMFKDNAENLKRGGYESDLHRLYQNLNDCPDITLAELALVGTTEKIRNTTIIVGEASKERIADALRAPKNKDD